MNGTERTKEKLGCWGRTRRRASISAEVLFAGVVCPSSVVSSKRPPISAVPLGCSPSSHGEQSKGTADIGSPFEPTLVNTNFVAELVVLARQLVLGELWELVTRELGIVSTAELGTCELGGTAELVTGELRTAPFW